MRPVCALATIAVLGCLMTDVTSGAAPPGSGRKPVDASEVARQPAPGSVVPGALTFTPDGKALTYLKSESASLSRVLWRVAIDDPMPRVVARPPGAGDTEATLSEAEKLRRERQRLRETGLTQVVHAESADV